MRRSKAKSKQKQRRKPNFDVIKVTSAIDLDEEIITLIKEIFGDKQMEFTKDQSITGGIIIQHGDQRFDGSISHQLYKLSQFIKA